MSEQQFFDDRMRYLAFIENTNEKSQFCELVFPYIERIRCDQTCVKILDAGTGDGSITTNIIRAFHNYHPNKLLSIFGKEISFKDLKSTLNKLSDRFMEHPKMLVTLTNFKFSEIKQLHKSNKINGKDVKFLEIELSGCNSYDFQKQIMNAEVIKFITQFWGINSNSSGNTQYTNPCVINVFRKDHSRVVFKKCQNTKMPDNFDLIIASQAYRSRSPPERKVRYVIAPLARLLSDSGELLITHSKGGEQINDILKVAFKDLNAFPSLAKDLIYHLQKEPKIDNYHYEYSVPSTYQFKFTDTPTGAPSELFGREIDAKIEALLYFSQITDQEIKTLNRNNEQFLKLRASIRQYPELTFINEFFTIKKLKTIRNH